MADDWPSYPPVSRQVKFAGNAMGVRLGCSRPRRHGSKEAGCEQQQPRVEDSQSSQVKCAFWQWKQARFAFFFLGPSRVRPGGCDDEDSVSLVASVLRLRFGTGFFFCSSAAGLAVREDGSPEKTCWPATCVSMDRPSGVLS